MYSSEEIFYESHFVFSVQKSISCFNCRAVTVYQLIVVFTFLLFFAKFIDRFQNNLQTKT
jgi:hypothetical protein